MVREQLFYMSLFLFQMVKVMLPYKMGSAAYKWGWGEVSLSNMSHSTISLTKRSIGFQYVGSSTIKVTLIFKTGHGRFAMH
jgi:hypothetical protein